MKIVGCTTPFGNGRYKKDICKTRNESIKAFHLWSRVVKYHKTDCLYPCQSIRTRLSRIYNEEPDGDSAKLTLKFEKYIKVSSSYISYTELELLAELGGYVGLFLGLSVFQIHEIFDKISELILNLKAKD